jgi:glycerol-3-phosphate acyltransferase PlsY
MINAPAVFGLLLTVAYLLGAIPFSVLISKFKGVDLRTIGSGNFGATNVYRALGLKYALLVFLLDAFKGALPVWYAMTLFPSPIIHILIGFTAIFGHTFSLFLGFKGGKGVATAAGVFAVLSPIPFGVTFLVVIALIFMTRMVSVGTLAGCIVLPSLLIQFKEPKLLVVSVSVVAFFIVLKHRGNIQRIIQGTENKLK